MSNPDEFKILLATDIHLGYQHKHELRGKDSLDTFEEILKIGKENEVDFILLGGDLFHENRPPRHIVNGCIKLLREYTFGDKEVGFDIVSDLSVNFEAHGRFPWPNYHDPNLNVAIPVFTIHGNHDDPTGCGAANAGMTLSVLNTLADAGVINYFGRQNDLSEVRIHPILFEKGNTKLAVFGLGALREERLHRLWREKKVHLMQQPGSARDDWFNIFVIHQNHVKHTETTYVPEESIDKSMDLVFWGHEHDCQIDPNYNAAQEFYVTQPGSSIATSLCEGETGQKHVGILRVRGKEFKIDKVPLQSVRQMIWKELKLCDHVKEDQTEKSRKEKVEKFCKNEVEKALLEAEAERNDVQPKEPLIRLRINRAFKSGEGAFETFNLFRFGEQFRGRVANTKDIIQFKNVKSRPGYKQEPNSTMKMDLDEAMADQVGSMEDVVLKHLRNAGENSKERLLVQPENPLTEAMSQYVKKGVSDAIGDYVSKQIENMARKLETRLTLSTISKEGISEDIKELADRRRKGNADIVKEEEAILKEALKTAESQKLNDMHSRGASSRLDDLDPDNEDIDVDSTPHNASARGRGGRGRGRAAAATSSARGAAGGRGSRGAGGRGRGRGKATVSESKTPSIMSSFMSQSSRNRDVEQISDDEDDRPPSRSSLSDKSRAKTVMKENRPSAAKKKPTTFDSDDSDEFDPTPAKRGRR